MQTRRHLLRLGLLCGGYSLTGGKLSAAAESRPADLASYLKDAGKIRSLFEKKNPPGPMDWLANHKEPGQSFAQYLKSNPNRRTAGLTKLYLQPIWDFSEEENAVLKKLRSECDPKLWWACKLEPVSRAKALADFSKRHSLEREAAEWSRIAKALGAD